MEIHSSSLAYIPKKVEAKNNNISKPSAPDVEDSLKKSVETKPESLANAKHLINVSDIDSISSGIKNLKKGSFNTQSNRALDAYIQENIQPLKDQRSQLISRVDFYI